jgi:hypothetical protein
MGKHAAPRTSPLGSRSVQRAAAISAGTFVLCLGAAAPALATTGFPTPPPVPQPVGDAVQQVSDTLGIPNPLGDSSAAKPHHHRPAAHAKKPSLALAHQTQTPVQPQHSAPTRHAAVMPASYSLGGLRAVPSTRMATLAGRVPTVASHQKVTRIAPAAAGSNQIGSIPMLPPTQDTGRILLVAVAVMFLGGLTSGHMKIAQQRIAAW